ncbi:MAG: ATP-binding cassette domain-containing protein [Candidatus Edwardsbacteria bacterium]
MNKAIIIKNLTKSFKRKGKKKRGDKGNPNDDFLMAVDQVNLEIDQGELFGLLGPNGAGKTTLVKCLSTLLLPNEGTAKILGYDLLRDGNAIRRQIGVTTGGERTLYWKLSARDNLKYFGALYGMSKQEIQERSDYLFEVMELKDRENERLEKYSTGMRQKVSVCRAILHNPAILLFDEPTLGLDPQFSRFLRQFIKEELNKKQGKTILLTTHYMDEADELCHRLAFINRGKIVAIDTPENLKRNIPFERILEIKCQGQLTIEKFKNLSSVSRAYLETEGGTSFLRIQTEEPEKILSEIIDLARKEAKILAVDTKEPTLEDVFIYLTGVRLTEDTSLSSMG